MEKITMEASISHTAWPELPYAAWADTRTTLHPWTQIVGKIRLAKSMRVNHSWNVTLYDGPRTDHLANPRRRASVSAAL
jgi:hypothetical protein